MVWRDVVQALEAFVNRFVRQCVGTSPLWDSGVKSRTWESTGAAGEYSLPIPASSLWERPAGRSPVLDGSSFQ